MMSDDFYELLGVSKNADKSAIKKAYRTMAKKYHPDKNPGDKEAEEMFKAVNEAYQVLSDDQQRAMYDQFGKAGLQGGAGGGHGGFGGGFDDIGSIFEEMFGGAFGGGGSNRGRKKRQTRKYNLDLNVEMRISFSDAIFGAKKEVNFSYKTPCKACKSTGAKDGKMTNCPQCGGQGQVYMKQGFMTFSQTCPACHGAGQSAKAKCPACSGRGYNEVEEQLTVDVPAGIDSENRLRVTGKGNEDENGRRGDLYITFYVDQDEHFTRHENNIYLEVPVFFTQAVLGETIKIPSIHGEVDLKLDVGTKDKQQFTFRGQGVPDVRGGRKGDFIAQVKLTYPKSLTKEQTELLEKLQNSFGVESKPHEEAFSSVFDKIKNFFS
jgi:molecular chaperone DnaJ